MECSRTFLFQKLPWIVVVNVLLIWTFYQHVLVMDVAIISGTASNQTNTRRIEPAIVAGTLDAACFTIVFLLTIASYFRIVFTSPGYVPLVGDEELGQSSHAVSVMMQNMTSGPGRAQKSFCSKCMVDRPARAHHCKMCGRCVLKMDHHCPWVANCVGLRNHKFFFLFVVYTTLLTAHNVAAIGLWGVRLTAAIGSDRLWASSVWLWAWANLIVSGFFFVTLVAFASYHAWLLAHNMTTLESLTRNNAYSLGSARANIAHNLGPNPALWWLPCWGVDDCLPAGTGGHYNPVVCTRAANGSP